MAMKYKTVLSIAAMLLLSACATTNQPQPEIQRITPEALQKLIPNAVATYSLQEIVADTKQNKSVDEIVAKIKASDSRYDLSASKILELHQQGVDASVLNYIQQSNELAKQNYIADEINKVEKEKAEALRKLNEERLMQMRQYYDPFWYGPSYPYRFRHWPSSRFGWGLSFGHPFWR
jgi:ABC-type microcin C transport system permease subunit YejB